MLLEDLGNSLEENLISEQFGTISVSELRWIDIPQSESREPSELFEYLVKRLVEPPKPVVYGGGQAPAKRMARDVLPHVKHFRPNAIRDEPLVGKSGRAFTADIYSGGPQPLVVSTLALGSNWQAVRAIEAKAFELFDVGRSFEAVKLAACCQFPSIDPEGVIDAASKVFGSIDVALVTPESIDDLDEQTSPSVRLGAAHR